MSPTSFFSFRKRFASLRQKRATARTPLQVEMLENRLAPAVYTWDDAANTLAMQLMTDESLNVSQGEGTVLFALNSGTFAQFGGDAATGSGTDVMLINNADLTTSLSINNNLAGLGFNNVTFSGSGSLSSGIISVTLTDPEATK